MRKYSYTALLQISTLLLFATMFTSCIGKRKYYEARNRADEEHAQILAMQQQVGNLQDTVGMLTSQLGSLKDVNQSANSELNNSNEKLNAQRQRLEQLQSYIDDQQKSTEALKERIANALNGFSSSDLTVSMKNGRVYVSMQEKLLFPSGSAVVNPQGKDALSKLAAVLNTNPDININIEGHTDSLPIHNKMFPDNWALSTARAVSIVRVLKNQYNVAPERLTASGRSQYDPVAPNSTDDGRALNRRTEIILEPKLDELAHLMNSNEAMPSAGSGVH